MHFYFTKFYQKIVKNPLSKFIRPLIFGNTKAAVAAEIKEFCRQTDPNRFGDLHGEDAAEQMKQYIADRVFRNLESNMRILAEVTQN